MMQQMMNGRLFLLLVLVIMFGSLSACTLRDGDWLGPAERTARTLTLGWDMWNGANVTPYEEPIPQPVPGTLSQPLSATYEQASASVAALSADKQQAGAERAYRQYCYHCHGPQGDGRIIVGESFDVPVADLSSEKSQALTDEEMYQVVMGGSANMISLAATVSPVDLILAIHKIRTLKGSTSRPFFEPRNTEPLE